MNLSSSEFALWNRIEGFSLDDPTASFAFTQRLARDNHWSLPFAVRVVEEYKRFMFLAVACEHVVTPSNEVDQAWHLHLVYTRSYWQEFCGEVLRRSIHHGPTRGGKVESTRYEDLYEQTKASYFNKFGERPPADIWPSSEIRFDSDTRNHWVSGKKYWLIRKPNFSKLFSRETLPLVAVAAVPTTLMAWSPFDLAGSEFLIFYAILIFTVAVLTFVMQRIFLRNGEAEWQQEQSRIKLTPNHVAFLSGGRKQLMESAMCELLFDGHAKSFRRQLQLEKSKSEKGLSMVARYIFSMLKNESSINYRQIKSATRVPVAKISADLAKSGLIQTKIERNAMIWMTVLMMAGVLGMGFVRIAQAMENQRPFSYLILEMGLFVGVVAMLVLTVPFRTKTGHKILAEQKTAARKIKSKKIDEDLSGKEIGFVVGALGTSALIGTVWSSYSREIGHVITGPISTGGGGADGGGCGGCGGGGGGGGCGGCGG